MSGKSRFRYGELFCGAGGLAFGALSAEVRKGKRRFHLVHAWANDKDPDAVQTYIANIPGASNDTAKAQEVNRFFRTPLYAEPIDALGFGFPCNDFSVVGELKGLKGDYGPLYKCGVRALKRHQPLWFIAENVSGLGNSNEGRAFRRILRDLAHAGMGYQLTPHLYHFEQYGVPQRRHRIIVVGIRQDLRRRFRVPSPTTPLEKQWKSAGDALKDIPKIAPNQELTRHSGAVSARLEALQPGQNAWSEALPVDLRLNVKAAKLSQIYKVLDPSLPAYTITGSGGGGTHGYHWERPRRALTNRERARLQTFSDRFEFHGGKESVRRQIGMAVPPDASKIIVEAILKTFARVPYESVQANMLRYLEEVASQLPLMNS